MELISHLRYRWHLILIVLIGVYSFQISQSGIVAFILGFQEPPPIYVWLFIFLVYGLILATVEFSPQLKPSSRTPKIILVLVVLFTLVVVLFSVPFVFQPSPDTADDLRIILELRATDSSGKTIDITTFDISCNPLFNVLRAGETAYTCTSSESSLFGSDIILQSFRNDLQQTGVVGLEWKRTRRTSPEYTSVLTTDDMTSSFSLVAPDAGAYYYSVTANQSKIERLVNRESTRPLNVSIINAIAARNTADSQRVYDERYLTGFRFQNLNIVVGLFAFVSIWLSTFNFLHTLSEDSSVREGAPFDINSPIVNRECGHASKESVDVGSAQVNHDSPEKGQQPMRDNAETSNLDSSVSGSDYEDDTDIGHEDDG